MRDSIQYAEGIASVRRRMFSTPEGDIQYSGGIAAVLRRMFITLEGKNFVGCH